MKICVLWYRHTCNRFNFFNANTKIIQCPKACCFGVLHICNSHNSHYLEKSTSNFHLPSFGSRTLLTYFGFLKSSKCQSLGLAETQIQLSWNWTRWGHHCCRLRAICCLYCSLTNHEHCVNRQDDLADLRLKSPSISCLFPDGVV